MSSRKRKRDYKETSVCTTPLERLPLGILSSFILPYLYDYDVKNACQTEIIEIQQYAYRTALWHIDEVTDVNRPFIQRVKHVTTFLEIKSMKKLIELHFRYTFNEPLEKGGVKLLPDGLKTLTLGHWFNKPLEGDGERVLPDTLQTLHFGGHFNQPLEADEKPLLPEGLQKLTLGNRFNQPLETNGQRLLPESLRILELRGGRYTGRDIGNLDT